MQLHFLEGVARLDVAVAERDLLIESGDHLSRHGVLVELEAGGAMAHVLAVDHVEEERHNGVVHLADGEQSDAHERLDHGQQEEALLVAQVEPHLLDLDGRLDAYVLVLGESGAPLALGELLELQTPVGAQQDHALEVVAPYLLVERREVLAVVLVDAIGDVVESVEEHVVAHDEQVEPVGRIGELAVEQTLARVYELDDDELLDRVVRAHRLELDELPIDGLVHHRVVGEHRVLHELAERGRARARPVEEDLVVAGVHEAQQRDADGGVELTQLGVVALHEEEDVRDGQESATQVVEVVRDRADRLALEHVEELGEDAADELELRVHLGEMMMMMMMIVMIATRVVVALVAHMQVLDERATQRLHDDATALVALEEARANERREEVLADHVPARQEAHVQLADLVRRIALRLDEYGQQADGVLEHVRLDLDERALMVLRVALAEAAARSLDVHYFGELAEDGRHVRVERVVAQLGRLRTVRSSIATTTKNGCPFCVRINKIF